MKAGLVNRILLVLAGAGVFVSGVLSVAEVFGKDVPCGPSHGCALVAQHPSSHMFGLPNAFLGFGAYLLLFVLASIRESIGILKLPVLVHVGYAIAALGTLFSLYLTYISITEIHALCLWCLTSAGIMVATLIGYAVLGQSVSSAPTEAAPRASLTSFILIPLLAILAFSGIGVEASSMQTSATAGPKIDQFTPSDWATLTAPTAHMQNQDGKVTVIEFGDLVCPVCRRIFPQVEKAVQSSNGKIRLVFHHYPLYMLAEHHAALPGAIMSEMAAEKGKFWEFVNAAYSGDDNAPEPDEDNFHQLSKRLGVDATKIDTRLIDKKDPAFKQVESDMDLAAKFGVRSTPTFFILAPGLKPQAAVGNNVLTVLGQPEYQALIK